MRIAVMQASSQKEKNPLLYQCTLRAVENQGHEVANLGVFPQEEETYSYIETALLASLLLSCKAADFVVTGCSSGQGMMLACNSLPGVLCGYVPTPQDAFLFGRINGGNAASLPLGLGFGWCGELNLQLTLNQLFAGDFGTGYPPEDAARKQQDAMLLKKLNTVTKRSMEQCLAQYPQDLVARTLSRQNVTPYLLKYGNAWIKEQIRPQGPGKGLEG